MRAHRWAGAYAGIVAVCALLLPVPGEPDLPTVTFALAGDVMLGREVRRYIEGDWAQAFQEVVETLGEVDIAFANLESPLTTASAVVGGHALLAPPEAVVALSAAGVDVVSLANNHALDGGEAGRIETRAVLADAGIAGVADGEHVCARQWCLLALYAAVSDPQAAVRHVESLNAEDRLLIVSLHWGGEYQAAPSFSQRALARRLADAGADLIVGHGPHVLQAVEWVDDTLVAYSLGNMVFDQPYPADCRQSVILLVTARGERIERVRAVATVTERGRVRRAGPDVEAGVLARLGWRALDRLTSP